MARRPVFVPTPPGSEFHVEEVMLDFEWSPGMSVSQKQKNIGALHAAANEAGLGPVLEVSSKSLTSLGAQLSAFNLIVPTESAGEVTVEAAFQGSKVFARSGPHPDMHRFSGREVKRDPRLTESGPLVAFEWNGERWSLEPKTAFYDWLYVRALGTIEGIKAKLASYGSFTDIEFNPSKSVSCQARSCALFVSLTGDGIDPAALRTQSEFVSLAFPQGPTRSQPEQRELPM